MQLRQKTVDNLQDWTSTVSSEVEREEEEEEGEVTCLTAREEGK